METFLKYANISDDVRFFYHRLEMYADESGNGERKLILLKISEKKSVEFKDRPVVNL